MKAVFLETVAEEIIAVGDELIVRTGAFCKTNMPAALTC